MASQEVSVKVKFEYSDANKQVKTTKDFEVKITLDEKSLEPNRLNILKGCNFRSAEERVFYHMFDPVKKQFLLNVSEIKPYIKDKKTILLKSVAIFAENILEQLGEVETSLLKNIDPSTNQLRETFEIDSKKEAEIRLLLFNLGKNYFSNDMFAEEFIAQEGIKCLATYIQYTKGNLRTYALSALNKILTFQSSYDYIQKRDEIIDILYEILMSTDTLNCSSFALDTLVKILSIDNGKTMYLIDAAEKYAKKTHTQIFSQIVNFLSEKNKDTNIKIKTLLFINILLNFCEPAKLPRVFIQLREAGIFDMLEKISKYNEKGFQEQLNIFEIKIEKIISDSDYEIEVYKNKAELMRTHCEEIEKKVNSFQNNNEFYESVIKDFVKYLNYCDSSINQGGKHDPKGGKERFDEILKKKIPVDPNGAIDFQKLISDENKKDQADLLDKYTVISKEFAEAKKRNEELKQDDSEIKNEKIIELENQLRIETDKGDGMDQEKQTLENKVKELEEKLSKYGEIIDEGIQIEAPTTTIEVKKEENTENTEKAENTEKKENTENPSSEKPPETPAEQPSEPSPGPPPPPPPPPSDEGGPTPPPPPGAPALPGAGGRGPKPTKPKVTLKAKVKQLQWQRVILEPESTPNRPNMIWNQMKETPLDMDEIYSLFEVKKKKLKLKKK